jgi:DNA-binding NarL/FixJ family response regulator
VESIRVLIAYESRLLRGLVRTIVSSHNDFEVVGEVQDEARIILALEQNQADFLIVEQAEPGRRPAICEKVFGKWPHMRILAVASGSEQSTLYWAEREIRSVAVETCEEGVVGALRGQVGSC